MKIWLLRPKDNLPEDDRENNPWEPWYDKAFGFVVRAETELLAREIAGKNGGDETDGKTWHGGNPWLDPLYSTCEELLGPGKPGVILRHYASA